MTSAKCFSRWIKEAGRGHMCAFVSWGLLMIYGVTMVTRLSFDTEFIYFGMGSTELAWICEGLGLFLSFFEFFYLLQQKKQDLYYSLPVSRAIIFWSRYVHGLVHFLLPLVIVMILCGIYEGTVDAGFLSVSVGYTGRSILAAAGVFLIFYHIGIVCLVICGTIVSALLSCGVILFLGDVFLQNVCDVAAENYFQTYYQIPLISRLMGIFAPMSLAGRLMGSGIYEKQEAFAYVPESVYIWAAAAWVLACLLVIYTSGRKRKTERTGKAYLSPAAERAAEIVISLLAGAWISVFLVDVTNLAQKSRPAAGVLAAAACASAALAVHCLMEWKFQGGAGKIFRRKKQLAGEIIAAVCAAAAFPIGAAPYDSYFPGEGELASVGISIDGLNMSYSMYQDVVAAEDSYKTDSQLKEYRLDGEGRTAAAAWLKSAAVNGSPAPKDVYTHVTVCYYMKDGSERYRTYPLDRAGFESFSSVFETEEYKEIAFQAPEADKAGKARFSWNDGVKERAMKVTEDEKEALVQAYREDRTEMKMADLSGVLPVGILLVEAGEDGMVREMPVYPSFGRTCAFLEKYGIDTGWGIEDYQVLSVEMYEGYGTPPGTVGGVSWKYYDTPEEIAVWQPRLVPEVFDLQPLLCPLDYSDVKAVVEDAETNSTIEIDCVLRSEDMVSSEAGQAEHYAERE